jgi:hypothetical protein
MRICWLMRGCDMHSVKEGGITSHLLACLSFGRSKKNIMILLFSGMGEIWNHLSEFPRQGRPVACGLRP